MKPTPVTGDKIHLSILIRVRNEAAALRELFAALDRQECSFACEFVVVDNDSEDDTRAVAESAGARIVHLPRQEFTYGHALNLGLRHARGELVMLLSAHSLPVGSTFLTQAVAPFIDPGIAAVRCLSTTDGTGLRQWYHTRQISYRSKEEQRLAEQGRKWTRLYPAATCCVIRRHVWELIPFDETLEGSEDKVWAAQVLARGFQLQTGCGAVYYYTRPLQGAAKNRKHYRECMGLYRYNGYTPIKLVDLVMRLVLAVPASLNLAWENFTETVVRNFLLYRIPARARRRIVSGSLPEFSAPNRSAPK